MPNLPALCSDPSSPPGPRPPPFLLHSSFFFPSPLNQPLLPPTLHTYRSRAKPPHWKTIYLFSIKRRLSFVVLGEGQIKAAGSRTIAKTGSRQGGWLGSRGAHRQILLSDHLGSLFSGGSAGAPATVWPASNSWTVEKVAGDGPPPLTAAGCSMTTRRRPPLAHPKPSSCEAPPLCL